MYVVPFVLQYLNPTLAKQTRTVSGGGENRWNCELRSALTSLIRIFAIAQAFGLPGTPK
jgi:hypothetical protein